MASTSEDEQKQEYRAYWDIWQDGWRLSKALFLRYIWRSMGFRYRSSLLRCVGHGERSMAAYVHSVKSRDKRRHGRKYKVQAKI